MRPLQWLVPVLALSLAPLFAEPESPAAAVPPELRGILVTGAERTFSLASSGAIHSGWVKVGDSFDGWELVHYNPEKDALLLRRDGRDATVGMAAGKVAPAGIKATLADADVVLQKMNFDAMIERIIGQQKEMVAKMTKQMAARFGTPEALPEEVADLQKKIVDVMWEAMKPEELRQDFAQAYSEVFTKDELRGLSDFLSTDAGRTMMEKQPQIQEKISAAIMPRMMEVMPRVQQMSREFAEEMKARSPVQKAVNEAVERAAAAAAAKQQAAEAPAASAVTPPATATPPPGN